MKKTILASAIIATSNIGMAAPNPDIPESKLIVSPLTSNAAGLDYEKIAELISKFRVLEPNEQIQVSIYEPENTADISTIDHIVVHVHLDDILPQPNRESSPSGF